MSPKHPVIIDAIQSNLQIHFRYHSENSQEDEPTDRVVEPWTYGNKNGKESLYGFQVSGGKKGLRRFDMHRVKAVKLTGEHMEEHPTGKADVTKWDNIFASVGKSA